MDKIVDEIIAIFESRGGFDDWWGNIDNEFQEEIKEEIKDVLKYIKEEIK